MRARWRLLFWISLLALIALSWTAQRLGVPTLGLVTVPFIGMVAAAVIAFAAMVTSAADRRAAGAVLVCALPMALDLVRALWTLGYFWRQVGFPAVLFVAGSVATIAMAAYILIAPAPKPPPDEPIARADARIR